jgi:hypothetical protein
VFVVSPLHYTLDMRSLVPLLLLVTAGSVSAQVNASDHSYLLRLERANSQGNACVLLQKTGFFHLETDRDERARVFEGTIAANQLSEIERALNDSSLASLTQRQIEEPLMNARRDTLQLHIFRGDHWQDLLFESSDSQEPFKHSLTILTGLLNDLGKWPHQEFTEEEGRNNCLPPKPIKLKKRPPDSPSNPVASLASSPKPVIALRPSRPSPPVTVSPLVRLFSTKVSSSFENQSCVLLTDDGSYRFEDRIQKNGSKQVKTEVFAARISDEQLAQFRQILADPGLQKIGHHEPPGNAPVSVQGDMIDISIARPNGTQRLVLSSGFNRRQVGFFYGGDADIRVARPLLKFLGEHIESNKSGALDPSLRNECTTP